MSDVQLENGYTRIANELLEAILKYNCPGNQKDIIWAVIRLSYGFSKKDAVISVSYLSKMLNRDKSTISKDLNSLIDKKVLTVIKEADFSTPRTIALNKDYSFWVGMEYQQLNIPQQVKGSQLNSGESLNSTVEESSTNKENIKKALNKYTVEDFEKFWSIFPNSELGNKGSKKNARKEFLKLNPSLVAMDTLITAINNQAEQKRKLKAEGKFFPQFQHVERWLKNERWTDDTLSTQENQKCYEPTTNFMKELLDANN